MKRLLSLLCILGVFSFSLTGCKLIHPSSSQSTGSSTILTDAGSGSSLTDTNSSADNSSSSSGNSSASGSSSPGNSSPGSSAASQSPVSSPGTSKPTPSTKAGTTTKSTTTTTSPVVINGELRGVWVSYPELNTMLKGKTTVQAKSAIDTVMSNAKSYGLNTVIFQVRAKSDAYYKSTVYNAAAAVQALLNAGFDPLQYAVAAAHSRGLQIQAWVNPYRIGTDLSYAKCSDHFSSGGLYYYDPASIAVQSLILSGIREIVTNYAVDGIQFDDYFYPGDTTVFPPSSPAPFEETEYKASGGKLGVADWRRANVTALISSVYNLVHQSPHSSCVFGISPGANINSNYSGKYADVKTWMANKGYIDYICPQIYYGFENSSAPFEKTLTNWISQPRSPTVKLYIGLALYKTGWTTDANAGSGKAEWAEHSDIMKRQVLLIRSQKACGGMMIYSYTAFDPNSAAVRDNKSYSVSVATSEISNLLSVMRG